MLHKGGVSLMESKTMRKDMSIFMEDMAVFSSF